MTARKEKRRKTRGAARSKKRRKARGARETASRAARASAGTKLRTDTSKAPKKPARTETKKKRESKGSKKKTALLICLVLSFLLVASLVFVYFHYRVKTIFVEGTNRYKDEEIVSMVFPEGALKNTLYLKWAYGDKGITEYPFIEKIDVQVVSSDTVRLIVYEKSLAGYISFLGQNMYFDREGIVVEAGSEVIEGVPQVLGLTFEYVVLNEKLPVQNEEVFTQILTITQLLDKYALKADKIFFDASYNTYLYFNSIECDLGGFKYLEEKLEQLVNILPELAGKSGIIRLKDYTPQSGGVIFESR